MNINVKYIGTKVCLDLHAPSYKNNTTLKNNALSKNGYVHNNK